MSDTVEIVKFATLKKHSYPRWVALFGVFILFLAVCIIPLFLWYELPRHRELYSRIKVAEKYFYMQDYQIAIALYEDIVNQYPDFTDGQMQIAKAYFALSVDDELSYIKGFLSLPKKDYKKSELWDLAKLLPQQYQEHFMSQFKRA